MTWPTLRPFNIGGDADPYLQRWFILPRNRWFCVYLHRMLRDDDDRALHDHPGANISIVLRGGYDERLFQWRPIDRLPLPLPPIVTKRRRPGTIVFRSATTAHRLSLPLGAKRSWSLFVVFRKRREWGFWCGTGADRLSSAHRWVPWREFTTGTHGQVIGKGCD